MDPLQSFLSHLSPSRAKSPAPPTKSTQIKPLPTPPATKSRLRRRRPLTLPPQPHKVSVPSSNLLAPHTPNVMEINPSPPKTNFRATTRIPEGRPGQSNLLAMLTQDQVKFKITAETPPDDIINYFEKVAKLNNYTSKLIHDQPPKLTRSGGAADVYRVTTTDHTDVAVKCLYVRGSVSDSKVIKRLARELEVWSTLRHKNILPLLGLARYQGQLAMVSHWMSSGSIIEYVKGKPDKIRYILSHKIVGAVAYLHAKEIVHGDLKGENVLISDDGAPMLTDFGLTMMAESNLTLSATNTGGGTLRYMAPELFSPKGRRSKEADIYALGMTILQILTGEQPFAEIGSTPVVISAVISQRKTPQRPVCLMPPSQLNDTFWEVMTNCWAYEPARRVKIKVIKKLMTSTLRQEERLGEKFRITVETSIDNVIEYFERTSKLDNYTSKLRHEQQPSLRKCGGMANVYCVATTNDVYVAVKCIHKHHGCEDIEVLQRSARELEVRSALKHKNILPLLGLAKYQDQLAVVSNWMSLGSVIQFVNDRPNENRYILSQQVVAAVAYVHAQEIVHGDLKGTNVLVSHDGTPMLSGFDLAIAPSSRFATPPRNEGGGTPRWMAPELLRGEGGRSKEADVYALGMTILEILTGELPFAEVEHGWAVFNRVLQRKIPQRPAYLMPPSQHNDTFWDVMTKCWACEPAQRATATEVAGPIETVLKQEGVGTAIRESGRASHRALNLSRGADARLSWGSEGTWCLV